MLIPYLVFGLAVGLFMSFIWSSKGGANALIKTGWVLWTLWTIVMLAVTLFPELAVAKTWG